MDEHWLLNLIYRVSKTDKLGNIDEWGYARYTSMLPRNCENIYNTCKQKSSYKRSLTVPFTNF